MRASHCCVLSWGLRQSPVWGCVGGGGFLESPGGLLYRPLWGGASGAVFVYFVWWYSPLEFCVVFLMFGITLFAVFNNKSLRLRKRELMLLLINHFCVVFAMLWVCFLFLFAPFMGCMF